MATALSSLSDLRLWYYGGESNAEHDYLTDCYLQGINAYDILQFVQTGGGGALPPGGTAGQMLTKNTATNFDCSWTTLPGGVPSATTTNLTFGNANVPGASGNFSRGDHAHGMPARELPTGGTTGQALAKTSGTDYAVSWQTIAPGSNLTLTPVKTSAYTAAVNDDVVCNASSNFTVTLPPNPANNSQVRVRIYNISDGVTVSVQVSSGDLMDFGVLNGLLAVGAWTLFTFRSSDRTWLGVSGFNHQMMPLNRFGSPSGTVFMNNQQINSLADPTNNMDALNRQYADVRYARTLTIVAEQSGPTITANPNEYLLLNTTSNAITITMPVTPANGTQVGGRITTLGTGNFVTFSASGSGDVFSKPGASASQANVIQNNNNGLVYEYWNGVWSVVASAWPPAVLDGRYVQVANQINIGAGPDITVNAPSGGVSTVQVAQVSHDLWTPLYVEATVDDPVPVVSSTTGHDDPVLSVNVVANAVYKVEALILISSDTPGKVRHSWAYPTGCTMNWGPIGQVLGNGYTGSGGYGSYIVTPNANILINATLPLGANSGGGVYGHQLSGILRTSTTAGAFKYHYAQMTSDALACTRKANSWLILHPLSVT